MMLVLRAALRCAAFLLAAWWLAAPALAQGGDKPPLRVVVGFAAGGNVDWVARVLAEKLRESLGRTVLVENKPGAGSRVAINDLRRLPADGNTVALTVDAPFTMYPYTVAKIEYDALKDYTPIVRVATFDYAIAVSATHPARNLREFMAWAAKHPKEASYASPGVGSGPSFVGELIGKSFGTPLTDVPYRGGGAANTDVIGGQIAATFGVLPDMLELQRAGKLRVLAVGGAKRSALVPDAPTLRESGVDFDGDVSVSFYGPRNLPPAFVGALTQAVTEALGHAELREQFLKQGLTPAPMPGGALGAAQAADMRKWEGIIKQSGFVPQ